MRQNRSRICHRRRARIGSSIDVLIDLNIGLNRCGVRTIGEARELAAAVTRAPNVNLVGLMGYEGRMRRSTPNRTQKIMSAYERFAEVKVALEADGHSIEIVSSAGTSTLREALAYPTITEIQAGTYALMEPDIEDLDLPFRPAVYVLGTVISRTEGRVILDVGRRSIGSDYGLPPSLHAQGEVVGLNDEHTLLSWTGKLPALGDQIRLRPTQNRTTFNLHDAVWVAQGDQITDTWPITARGRS